jgi:DNA-binding MurR/RpiR family transcriptional regulator
MNITNFADKCNVGEATIIRFCQSLGLKGFQGLKLSLAKDLVSPLSNINLNINNFDSMFDIAQKISYGCGKVLEETMKVLNIENVQTTVDLFVKAQRILFCGLGNSGLSAFEAKYRFLQIGLNCDCQVDSHFANMSAALLEPGDLIVGFSNSGSTKDVVECMRIAKKCGVKTIVVTSYSKSPIIKTADIVLLTAAPETPLSSGTYEVKMSQLFVIHLLFTGVSIKLKDKVIETNIKTAHAVLDKQY